MWIKATDGKSYNLDHALEIEVKQRGSGYVIEAGFKNPVQPATIHAHPSPTRTVTLIGDLSREDAEEQYEIILGKLEAVKLPIKKSTIKSTGI